MSDLLDKLISQVDEEQLFAYYLKPYFSNRSPKPKVNISNPFIERKQETPSFNYFKTIEGRVLYYDFATMETGSIIDLVMNLFKCSNREAIQKICNDFNISIPTTRMKVGINKLEWSETTMHYWDGYKISKEILQKFDVFAIEEFSKKRFSKEEPIFSYQIDQDCFKVYCPFSKEYKFRWIGNKPKDYIFGFKQLPSFCHTIYIAAGEKDVLSLASIGECAVCFNSETSIPSNELIEQLKAKSNELVVLYDHDETGINQSKRLAEKFNIGYLIIPKQFLAENEKDISDVLRKSNCLNQFKYNVQYIAHEKPYVIPDSVKTILKTKEVLRQKIATTIVKPVPLITLDSIGVIYPKTINIIQGKAGVHKSRLAENLCAALLTQDLRSNDFLGFKRNPMSNPTVCYVDTERNLSHQFPFALQQIINKSGFTCENPPESLDFISILEHSRDKRFKAVEDYLEYLRVKYSGQLILILDVITDCIKDFNRSEDSMQLIDLLNTAINQYDVTIIALIHENPGVGDKARGHLGTELMNKASTVLQIGFEKDKNNKPTELISVNFLKTRATKKLDSLFIKYCENTHGLVLASQDEIAQAAHLRQVKADIQKVINYFETNYSENYENQYLISELTEEFLCSEKIIRERLKEIIDNNYVIKVSDTCIKYLTKVKQGKNIIYKMIDAIEQ